MWHFRSASPSLADCDPAASSLDHTPGDVAGFLAGGKDWGALSRSWKKLAAEYPGNRFATHASVIEDAPDP